MTRKHCIIVSDVLFYLSIAFAAAHLLWYASVQSQAIDLQALLLNVFHLQALLLNVFPYGIPIAGAFLARREFRRESPRWNTSDRVFAALFSLSYLAMIVHVTVSGILGNFLNDYFNLPLLYLIPVAFFGLAWLIVRAKPSRECSLLCKVFYSLPLVVLLAMVVHCGILCIIECNRSGVITSFPWWTLPLLCATAYLIGACVLFAVYAVVLRLQKRKGAGNQKSE